MNRLRRCVDRVLETALAIGLSVMVAAVATNVFGRYLLGASLAWSDELAQILLVWLTFLGAAAAYRHHELFSFDPLLRQLPRRVHAVVAAVSRIVVIAMTAALFFWSSEIAWEIRQWTMPATGVSRAFVYGACPVGSALILFYSACEMFLGGPGFRVQGSGPAIEIATISDTDSRLPTPEP